MEAKDTIYTRRSIRNFTSEPVDRALIEKLLQAAVQAPSAMNLQPWAFSVMQEGALLDDLSEKVKAYLLKTLETRPYLQQYKELFSNPEYNVFYQAPVLLTIYAKPEGPRPEGDCCLAAQNLMLAAKDLGLGSCWIGFSLLYLNDPQVKAEMGVPKEYTIVAPLAIGYPAANPPPVPRKEPELVYWKE